MGVEIITNTEIESADDLKNSGHDAVLIAVGAHRGRSLNTEGMEQNRVYTAVEFLQKISLQEEIDIGEKIAVIGGGNVAFDCARTAVRLNGKTVELICLEPRYAMMADQEEISQGEEEGIRIHNSKAILGIEGIASGPTGVKHIEVKKFSFDQDGQLAIEPIEGSERVTEADTIIVAAGQYPQIVHTFGVELDKANRVVVKNGTLETSKIGVFAAGDAIYGTKSVVEAVASGRKAASAIDQYLGGNGDISEVLIERQIPNGKIGRKENFAKEERELAGILKGSERVNCFCKVDLGLDEKKAAKEAGRCLQCDLRVGISKVKFWGDYKYK
jgi:NADPH-dependent glutamate synthase beta subunit-like oxidoreductase